MSILSELGTYLKDNRAVKEFASSGSFPATGKVNTVYVDKSTDKIYYWDGSTYAGIDAETLDGLNSTQFLRSDIDTTATGSITINNINKSLKIGDVTGDNYTEIKHTNADGYGFDFQHNNASVVLNQKGVTNEVIVLGDVDSANGSTLFGIGHSTDSGSTWSKKLNYTGTGELYIGINGTSRAFHDGYHPNVDKLTTARTISLSGDVTGSVSFDGSSNVDIVSTVADNSHNHTIANVSGLQSALDNKVDDSEKGSANGVATLDANGKVTLTQIPDSVLGQLEYQGVWNFTTLPTATQKGQYWIASVSGNGYEVGDWAVWNGTAFDKVDNTDAVASVAGRTGNVVLTKSDVGLNLVDNTADASKNVLSATKWTTARTVTLSGDVVGSASVDGSANVTITTTIQPNSVALGTDTTGNYMVNVTAGSGISVSHTQGEGSTATITNSAPNVTTNITTTHTSTNVVVNSSDGTDGTINSATQTLAGVMSAADKTKLDGIEAGATGDQTASEILTLLKTVDGSGSGVDADLLDGQEGNYYLNASNINTGTINDSYLPDTITSDITGNAATATKLATIRTIALTGDVTGHESFDGSGNISIITTVADDSHNHVINNVDGLQAALDSKANQNNTYTKTEVDNALALKVDDTEIASVNLLRADKYLAAQNVVNMSYNLNGKLEKVQYNNATDVDYEVLTYNGDGKLSNVAHYVGGVLQGNTVLSYYSNGKLVSAPFTAV